MIDSQRQGAPGAHGERVELPLAAPGAAGDPQRGGESVVVPVVVLNTFITGLAIGRDLGRLGIRVIGLSATCDAPGNYSRWLEYRRAPDSLTQPKELESYLLTLSEELGRPALLLPTRDHDINFLGRSAAVLSQHFIMPMLSPVDMDRVLNKDWLAAAAAEAGLCVPKAVTVTGPKELDRARALRYPSICKPVYGSQWRKRDIWEAVGRQKALRVQSFEELQTFYRSFAHLDPLVSVQEWVEGGETNLQVFGSYCSVDHEVVAFFTARKRLQYPPFAGTGIVMEALPLPDLEAPSRTLLRLLRFRGISEIEFKRDDRDGRLYLIEINPRHWDQHGLGTAVGVNLSEVMYRDVTCQPARPMKQTVGRRIWIAEADYARHLARVLLGRAPASDVRLMFGAPKCPAVFDSSDLRPFLSLLGLTPKWRTNA